MDGARWHDTPAPKQLIEKNGHKQRHNRGRGNASVRSSSAPPAALLRTAIHRYSDRIRKRIEQIKELGRSVPGGASAPEVKRELEKLLHWVCKKAAQSRSLAVVELASAFPHDLRVSSNIRFVSLIHCEPSTRIYGSALPKVHRGAVTMPPIAQSKEPLKSMAQPGLLTLPPVMAAR